MTLERAGTAVYYPQTVSLATFSPDGPQPQFLVDSSQLRVVLAGLEAGQEIPSHPEALAVYHFLEGRGDMFVNGETLPVGPGTTVVAPPGSARGMHAATRLVFLAAKAQGCGL